MYRQKDVVLIPFPFSDLTGSKQRPALILSNERLHGSDKICCLITSAKPAEGIEIKGLRFRSWAKPCRLFTIDSRIIRKRLASVNASEYKAVFEKVKAYIG